MFTSMHDGCEVIVIRVYLETSMNPRWTYQISDNTDKFKSSLIYSDAEEAKEAAENYIDQIHGTLNYKRLMVS